MGQDGGGVHPPVTDRNPTSNGRINVSVHAMTPVDSRQIELLRVFCITAMMWVHVNPGISTPTIVSSGEFHLVGTILGNSLGRISVSLLSFVSGYLLWRSVSSQSFLDLARHRFRSVVVPMLVWSAIFIILAVSKGALAGRNANAVVGLEPDYWSFINAWTGIGGATANLSLFFLRDLFVATLIVRLLAPVIQSYPLVALALALFVPSHDLLAPVIFRDSILQFLLFGAVAARMEVTFSGLSRPIMAISIGNILTLAGVAALDWQNIPGLADFHIPLLMRRLGLCFLLLGVTGMFLRLFPNTVVIRFGRFSFLAYLMHVPMMGVLWTVWQSAVGDGDDQSYLIFYLGAPIAVFVCAAVLDKALDAAPDWMQFAMRGKKKSLSHGHPMRDQAILAGAERRQK